MPVAPARGGLLELEGVAKHYRLPGQPPVAVLRELDLRLAAGEFVALTGPSGSGKSTLMNILGCLDTPDRGRYRIDGAEVARLGADALARLRNRHFGFVFQGFNLLARASLADNVALPLLYAGVARRDRERRARELLAQVGLAGLETRRPNQLSGGQQQRVAIARALANHPDWLLADEPTGNLDSRTSDEIMQLLAGLHAEGLSILLVTHEAEIARHASRLLRFADGRIIGDLVTDPRRV